MNKERELLVKTTHTKKHQIEMPEQRAQMTDNEKNGTN